MPTDILPRNAIDKKYTWNAESVYPTTKAWDDEAKSILESIPSVKKFQARLKDGPATLVEALNAIEEIFARTECLAMYASFAYSVETTDQDAAAMASKAQGVAGQVAAAIAFLNPELLEIGHTTLRQWVTSEPALARYEHYIDNLFRKQAHIRSTEVEEILGMLAEPFSGPSTTSSMLTNADFKYRSATDSAGNTIELTEGALWKILSTEDRQARQTAWENYMDKHLEFKNTLSSNLANSIKQNVFQARARKHESSLAASLFEDNIPAEVFHNLLATFKKNLPVWQRYFRIRKKGLGVAELQPYDMWAPLTKNRVKIPFEQAVDWIATGLLPLGKEYVGVLRNGCLEERWVDVYPNLGKRTGAFSWGTQNTHPFIMMSYTDEIFSLSTLAHELGHSMHSYLSWENQPKVYANYSLFVAEVASNFNQAMVRAHLLQTNQDPVFQVSLIEEAMANFYRYFFIMPTLARFELATHQRIEKGGSLNADDMIGIMADLFSEGYGDTVQVQRERVGMTWAYFPHMFNDFYVYQYATGISGAHALSGRILRGEPNAVQDYLGFLKSGSSGYPLEVLKKAGVDLASPQPVEETFAVMSGYIDRLETLLG
jgi:oligoendopeptidase F